MSTSSNDILFENARSYVLRLRKNTRITSDRIRGYLQEKKGITDFSKLGAAMVRMEKEGILRRTGSTVPSIIPSNRSRHVSVFTRESRTAS